MAILTSELDTESKGFIERTSKIFEVKLKTIPKLLLVDTREEFNALFGTGKTERWLVAFVLKNNIVIFNKDTIEKETTHKKEEHSQLIRHEIAHILYFKKFRTHQPV